MLESIIGEVIIAVIIMLIGFTIKGSLAAVTNKLDTVLANQQSHQVEMAEIKKDVESNNEWGRDSKRKIEDHEKRINEVEKNQSALLAKIS